MTRLPWDPAEIGTHEPDLDHVADRLTSHAAGETGGPYGALVARIQSAVDEEPLPVAPWWQRLGAGGQWQAPARLLAAAAVLVAGVIGGLALGEFAGQVQKGGSGSSPAPLVSPSSTPSPTPSPSASPTSSPTPTVSPSPTAVPPVLTSPLPTVEAFETPEPSESDNSGPGGGNSGPGGGSSGPDG